MANARWIKKQIAELNDKESEDLLMHMLERRPLEDIKADRDDRTKLVPMANFIEAAKKLYRDRGKVQGLSTGIRKVDQMTKGMLGGELILIGGQSHHGKTQLATNIAVNVARAGNKVTFVTLEMTKPQITERIMDTCGGEEETEHIQDRVLYQEAMNLDYRDVAYLTGKAKKMGSKLIIIDHLHYFVRNTENQSNEIGAIVKNFSEFSKVHDIPVILVSHVTKLPPQKRPELNDFRDSSFIGQDCDIALMVWSDTRENAGEPDRMEVLLRKNRPRGMEVRFNELWRKGGGKLIEEQPHREQGFGQVVTQKESVHIPTEELDKIGW